MCVVSNSLLFMIFMKNHGFYEKSWFLWKIMIFNKNHDFHDFWWFSLKIMIFMIFHDFHEKSWFSWKGVSFRKNHDFHDFDGAGSSIYIYSSPYGGGSKKVEWMRELCVIYIYIVLSPLWRWWKSGRARCFIYIFPLWWW